MSAPPSEIVAMISKSVRSGLPGVTAHTWLHAELLGLYAPLELDDRGP